MKPRKDSLADALKALLAQANEKDILIKDILSKLVGKGQAALLIIFSLPFCQPIQIPGFSIPFGIMIAFIGLRIAFGRRIWIPQWILNRKISSRVLKKIVDITIKIINKLRFLVSTRLVGLVKNHSLRLMHGLTVAVLGFILAIPLPIPLTNLLAAFPILAFGLGMLEEDGVAIIIAYFLSLVCFAFVGILIWLGKAGLTALASSL